MINFFNVIDHIKLILRNKFMQKILKAPVFLLKPRSYSKVAELLMFLYHVTLIS